MGGHESKIKNPSANVVNDLNITIDCDYIYFIIIISLLVLQILITVYQLHKRSLKKNYMRTVSLANDIDKV